MITWSQHSDDRTQTPTWTLTRFGETITCTLTEVTTGGYVLQVVHDGEHLMDVPCAHLQDALLCSLDIVGQLHLVSALEMR